jgi:hypothetical protein
MCRRDKFSRRLVKLHKTRICREIVDEIVLKVRTPTPPPPDYKVYENREIEFEKANRRRLLYYSDTGYNLFNNLAEEIKELANLAYQYNTQDNGNKDLRQNTTANSMLI